jgi:hypothetical protein
MHSANSWSDFETILSNNFQSWAFRGQKDKNWLLQSTLQRYLTKAQIHSSRWEIQEQRILRVFKRKANHFLTHLIPDEDDFQWLALMQHHGAPTRLLDFTWSPYVAAFFALINADTDAAIWCLNTSKIFDSQKIGGAITYPEEASPRMIGNFEKFFLCNRYQFVWVGEPLQMNRRLVVQSGTFAVPGVIDKSLDQIIAGYSSGGGELIEKIELPLHLRTTALKKLYDMNIRYESLFPDLDGLARSMGYELEFHWGFDPITGLAYSGFNEWDFAQMTMPGEILKR